MSAQQRRHLAMLDHNEGRRAAAAGEGDWAVSRRSFLRAAGFAFAGAAVGACDRSPTREVVPFLEQPEEVTPGRSVLYASTCGGCSAGCGILTKNRDGRPIKIEGNPSHPVSQGGLCAIGQAMILSLYDSQRLRYPTIGTERSTWADVDHRITEELSHIRAAGGSVRILASTITSPTTRVLCDEFLGTFSDGRLVEVDALSASAILDAHERTHHARVLPRYRFERAEVVVSFDADFLGTWISPVEHTAGWRAARDLESRPPRMSSVTQIESRLSLTGGKADRRVAVRPDEIGLYVQDLAARLARRAGSGRRLATFEGEHHELLEELAERLWAARGRALVVSGSNDTDVQALVNFSNHLLGAYGRTLDVQAPSYQRRGKDADLVTLVDDMRSGRVAALFVYRSNPAYELPDSLGFADALDRVPLSVSFAERLDETASRTTIASPDHHPSESWDDAEPVDGVISVSQPALEPMFGTRAMRESVSRWMGRPARDRDIIRAVWRQRVQPRQSTWLTFDELWDHSVHDGFALLEPAGAGAAFDEAAPLIMPVPRGQGEGLALALYPKVGMRAGQHAHNPWLQELPDPISKVVWDNYAALEPSTARRLGIAHGDVVRVSVGGRSVELPAHLQPGQHPDVVAIALGYGRKGTDRFADIGPSWMEGRPTVQRGQTVGKRAAGLLEVRGGTIQGSGARATVSLTGRTAVLACTQDYHSLDEPAHIGGKHREIVQETTALAFTRDPAAGAARPAPSHTLWPADHPNHRHRWGLAVDLSACTGCSACVIGCQSENNVPVVGRDEVFRHREMHWLRIDRYYAEGAQAGQVDVAQQPLMCQHCANAPCETVCPVLATVHSDEGLNQQVYNRCVGTRYCANNCPYKTRRFNWFDYRHEDVVQNMALNPDVTIRTRGIMEKCSMCVQRIQEAKHEARRHGSRLRDGDIQTACQQSCPSRAIVFGDLNDPASAVSRLRNDPRAYRVLEELDVRESVFYLRLVRNREGGGHE